MPCPTSATERVPYGPFTVSVPGSAPFFAARRVTVTVQLWPALRAHEVRLSVHDFGALLTLNFTVPL